MMQSSRPNISFSVVKADRETPRFTPGDRVKVGARFPIGHYRVPRYIRGKVGVVESALLPRVIDNEEEGFGANAGARHHYYRVSILLTELWPDYVGSPRDELRTEVIESWLEHVPA